MANILTTQLAAEFGRPDLDDTDFERVAQLIHVPTVTTIDISDRVESFGTVRFEVWNVNPSKRGNFQFPRMSWSVRNPDGYFTPGHAAEIWNGYEPQEWRATYEWQYTDRAGTMHSLFAVDFDLLEVQLEEELAVLVSIHQLARAWARRWDREDRHATNWGAVPHTVNL
jgi:hypothetical protein